MRKNVGRPEQRGMKKKGKMVPNCVPKGSVKEDIGEKIKRS